MKRLLSTSVRDWSRSGDRHCPNLIDVTCPFCSVFVGISTGSRVEGVSIALHGNCPSCRQVVRFWVPNPEVEIGSIEIYMYPQSVRDRDPLEGIDLVPDGIRRSYINTLASYKSENWVATAVMCRRTLEGVVFNVLKDKAKSMALASGLRELPKHVDLGRKILEPMDALRQGGNLGAHFVEDSEPDHEVASAMLSFLEYLLEFVYVLPHKAAALSSKIQSLADQQNREVKTDQSPAI